jgi:hypothetical protein
VAIDSPKLSASSLGEIRAALENFISVFPAIAAFSVHHFSSKTRIRQLGQYEALESAKIIRLY